MRAALSLVAAVTLVTACAPAASSPVDRSPSPAGASLAVPATGAASPPAQSGAAPAAPPASAASPASGIPSGPVGPSATATAVAAIPPGPPLAPNPYRLGGPAPVGSFILGDSIALGVAPQLTVLGYPVVGIVGRTASDSYLREHLTTSLAQQAPAWVIVLGTNNRGDDSDVARLEGLVDLIDSLRTAGDRQRVYWVTPHRDSRYAGGMAGWNLEAFGAELDRLAGERRWLEVIDFAATARLHPEWYDADAGRLHPDARGQGVLAALIAGPDAVPVEIPAPLFSGAPTPSPEPEPEPTTFVNSPRDPRPAPTPTATPTPASTPTLSPAPADAASPASTPVPLEPALAPSPVSSAVTEGSTAPATPS